MKKQLLTPNKWSRPQRPLEEVRAIAMHWVENPGTSAQFNWNYFEGRKNGANSYGSTHFLIDETETVWALPLSEMGYHVGPASSATQYAMDRLSPYANSFCLGIELCHPDDTGVFEEATLWQAAGLCAELCRKYSLDPMSQIIRHYDVTGKVCPKYWVNHSREFDRFKLKVVEIMSVGIQLNIGVSG